MKSMITFAALALASIAWSATASAQEYNLRTVPPNPPAGVSFMAAFDSTECEDWVLLPLGQPPVVTVQGNLVRLEVDRITLVNCSNPPRTNTLSVPALPAGNYQLELIARGFESPGNDIFAQAVSFQIGPATAVGAFTIPATNRIGSALLVGLMVSLGYTLFRRRL